MGFRKKVSTEVKEEVKETKATPPSSSGQKVYINDALTVVESKAGTIQLRVNEKTGVELFVKDQNGNLKAVTGFITKDPLEELEKSVEAGRLSAEKAEEIAKKISFVLGNVTVVAE